MPPPPCTRVHHAHQAATAWWAWWENRASDGNRAGLGTAAAAVTGAAVLAAGGATRTGDDVGCAGEAAGDASVLVAGAGAADAGGVRAGAPAAVCRATPGGRLISTLTAASTAAKATTPASTVMDVRKLISSIRVYMTSRNACSPAARDAPPGRRRVRSV